MRFLLALPLLLAAGCTREKPLTLPTEPIDRAAACAVVAAADARLHVADVKQPLPLEAQGRILHYAMLAGVKEEGFDPQAASAVSQRMRALEPDITKGKWQELAPACHEAFPAADEKTPSLPGGRTDALLQCDEVAGFLLDALQSQNAAHADRLAGYRQLKQKLDTDLVAGLRARAGTSPAAQQRERRKALAAATSLGSPVPLLDACAKRFD